MAVTGSALLDAPARAPQDRRKSSRGNAMCRSWVAAAAAMCAVVFSGGAQAQKSGGILRLEHIDNPPSASIHEEGTQSVVLPFMAVFNNLVLYDQHVARNSLDSIRPD